MLKSDLINVVNAQKDYFDSEEYIHRKLEHEVHWNVPTATIISGVRRCGKSTMMRYSIQDTGLQVGYLHFDDPRLMDFKVLDFYTLEEIWNDKDLFHFDEIHRISEWELYIRQAVERKRRIGITGSNAHLMSSELGTVLTGRHLTYELFPFSYKEFLLMIDNNTPGIATLEQYFKKGGFPDAIKYNAVQFHIDLFNDIIQKDIMVRRNIRNQYDLVTIALHLLNNIARPFTSTKLAKNYAIKSVKTVTDFIGFLEDVYLIFVVSRYSPSYKKQVNNSKKVYAIDHAFAKNNSTQFQDDIGRQLENMVFIELRRRTKDIFYFLEKNECDFITKARSEGFKCYQVSVKIDSSNKEREMNGLIEALNYFNLSEGDIITFDQEDKIVESNKTIHLIPFWKWVA